VETKFLKLEKLLGEPLGKFRPTAYTILALREIIVARRDCTYVAEWISQWADLHREGYRRWYLPSRQYVGFSLYCPKELGLRGLVRVRDVLDRVLAHDPKALGKKRRRFYRLAGCLTVSLVYKGEEEE
jgi:hypothetical protein